MIERNHSMNIYVTDRTPYTYLIGWSKLNTYYYGLRFAEGCHPAELWRTYFTSSIYVAEFVKQHGNPDIIEIRKTFTVIPTAQLWEHRVLKRMKVIHRNDFLNRTDNKSISTDNYSQDSWKQSHKSRKKHIEEDPEFKQLLADKFISNMHSESASAKRKKTFSVNGHSKGKKNPRYGTVVKGTEVANNISAARKLQTEVNKKNGKRLNAKVYTCEYCSKSNLSVGNYKRWHHTNCRLIK